jgi:hypothetical protein
MVTAPAGLATDQGEQPSHPTPSTWIGLIDRVVGDTAPTVRTAILLIIVIAGLITLILVGFGLVNTMFLVGAGAAVKVVTGRFNRARQI